MISTKSLCRHRWEGNSGDAGQIWSESTDCRILRFCSRGYERDMSLNDDTYHDWTSHDLACRAASKSSDISDNQGCLKAYYLSRVLAVLA